MWSRLAVLTLQGASESTEEPVKIPLNLPPGESEVMGLYGNPEICIVKSTPWGPQTSLKTHLPGSALGLNLAVNSKEMPMSPQLLPFFSPHKTRHGALPPTWRAFSVLSGKD